MSFPAAQGLQPHMQKDEDAGQKPPIILIGEFREIRYACLSGSVMAQGSICREPRRGGLLDAVAAFHVVALGGRYNIIRVDLHGAA